jgi:hypothetical protein
LRGIGDTNKLIMDIQQDRGDRRPVIVLGAKPLPRLPAVEPQAVITTKGAVELGLVYREKYGTPIIALVPVIELYSREYMIDLLKKVKPEEIVVLGNDPGFDPVSFIRNELGLTETKITLYTLFERNFGILRALGWYRVSVVIKMLAIRGLRHFLFCAIPDLFHRRTVNWLSRSTGINGMLYAQERFPDAETIIVAGIGLEAGGHFNGRGTFTPKSAKSDQILMKRWKKHLRPRIVSTDERLTELGDVPLWQSQKYLKSQYSE